MPAIPKGRSSSGCRALHEGMDLDLKGGCQVGEGRRVARCRSGVVKGGEWRRPGEPEDRRLVEQLASRQWHSG